MSVENGLLLMGAIFTIFFSWKFILRRSRKIVSKIEIKKVTDFNSIIKCIHCEGTFFNIGKCIQAARNISGIYYLTEGGELVKEPNNRENKFRKPDKIWIFDVERNISSLGRYVNGEDNLVFLLDEGDCVTWRMFWKRKIFHFNPTSEEIKGGLNKIPEIIKSTSV